ncbi:Rapid ALkalinization Factor [Arabidopsis suecica]|uniref:Rapid ALkalinization Factor n=1 Tax=Arabidopsis suecica TaxID=45249 RepID=A0A8T1YNG9_ARASU|nr:Rapid ALkalinization Factor [Arabidopsis suecica]
MRGLSTKSGAILIAILTVNFLFAAVTSQSAGFTGDFMQIDSKCNGTIAECSLSTAEEFEMDSEINRRILATTKYISYGALRRNTVPCSRRGASYYNCRRGAQANPYSRGCSAITRCRR